MADNIDFEIQSKSSKKFKKYITEINDKTRLKIGNHKYIDLIGYRCAKDIYFGIYSEDFIEFHQFIRKQKIVGGFNGGIRKLVEKNLVDYLIGINFECCDSSDQRPVYRIIEILFLDACEISTANVIKSLLERINNNSVKSVGFNEACERGDIEIISMLLDELDHSILNFNESLHYALDSGNLQVIKKLIEHGANINLYKNRLLVKAIKNNFSDITEFLLSKGADIGKNEIIYCMESNHVDTVEFLLNKLVFDQGSIDDMFVGSCDYSPEIVQLLIDNGANVKKYGDELCRDAMKKGNMHLVKYLETVKSKLQWERIVDQSLARFRYAQQLGLPFH